MDCIEFTPNPDVYLKLSRFGLKELGDFQWPEHLGIFTIPVQIAVKYNIPLIIWGENPQLEYGKPTDINNETILDKRWTEENGGYFLDKIKPIDMIKYGFKLEDLHPYIYPPDDEIRKVGVTGIFLGTYLKWNIFEQLKFVKGIGFEENNENKEGTYNGWENLDVYFTVFHDYFKFLKYGFGRATDHASIEIRYGRISREEGLELVKKHEGKIPRKFLKKFLEFADLTMDEFLEICDKFTNKEIFKVEENMNVVRDSNGEVIKLKYDNDEGFFLPPSSPFPPLPFLLSPLPFLLFPPLSPYPTIPSHSTLLPSISTCLRSHPSVRPASFRSSHPTTHLPTHPLTRHLHH